LSSSRVAGIAGLLPVVAVGFVGSWIAGIAGLLPVVAVGVPVCGLPELPVFCRMLQ